MTTDLRAKFLIVDGRWIAIKDITHIGDDGMFLRDGQFIAGRAK